MRATVSVIIPCFNAAPWIRATLTSVVSQSYEDMEIIAVDDGSTDATPEIISNEFTSVRLIRTANHGASAARNLGTSESSGDFIQYLDHDDLLAPGKIVRQIHALNDSDGDVAYGAYQEIDEQGMALLNVKGDWPMDNPTADLLNRWWPTGAYLFRKGIVAAVGSWDVRFVIVQDQRFVQECSILGAKFVYCPGLAAFYRLVRNSPSKNKIMVARDLYKNAIEIRALWDSRGESTEEGRFALMQSFCHVVRISRGEDPDLLDAAKQQLDDLKARCRPSTWIALSRKFKEQNESQLQALLQPVKVTLATQVQIQSDLSYRISSQGDKVLLFLAGGDTLALPSKLQPVLADLMPRKGIFPVADLHPRLTDSSKVILAQKLVENGVLTITQQYRPEGNLR